MFDYTDYLIEEVNKYIVDGKKPSRGEPNVRAAMMMAIERTIHIHPKAIEAGHIDFGRYKKEIRTRKKWWGRVRRGDATDSRTGFDMERAGYYRVGERGAKKK